MITLDSAIDTSRDLARSRCSTCLAPRQGASSARLPPVPRTGPSHPSGDQPYTIVVAPATSTDPLYGGVDAADVAVVNTDNEIHTLRDTLGLAGTTFTGAGVGVAVIDSGVAATSDTQGRVVAFRDFTAEATTGQYDRYGHGTHVAGLIGGNGILSASARYAGVASKANLIALRCSTPTASG